MPEIWGLTFNGGDFGSLAQLFFDNLSTILGVLGATQNLLNIAPAATPEAQQEFVDTMNNIVWGKIAPGIALTMLFGNIYYSILAIRMTRKYKRPYTAQPYGVNTPAAFAYVFSIIYAVFFDQLSQGKSNSEALTTAYNVCLAANFITGIIGICLGAVGPEVIKYVPPAALLVPLAGIGFAFLGLQQIVPNFGAPIVGFLPFMFIWVGWYSGVTVGYKNFRCPEALQIVILGIILGWSTGYNQGSAVSDAAKLVKWWGPSWTGKQLFDNFGMISTYLGTVIPVSISAVATSLMCLVSAKAAGDPYPVRESMIADGFGTLFVSFFGSPFGTVMYIGHPVHKRNGARTGYSVMNGFIYIIVGWFGILALFNAIINPPTIGPIIFFVGLLINEEALNFMPSRHYSAFLFGIMPSVCDWLTNESSPPGRIGNSWIGILALKYGAMLISLVWVSIIVNIIDRRWWIACVFSAVGALFAAFGIIHQAEAGVSNFTTNFTDYYDDNGGFVHQPNLSYLIAYLMTGAVQLILEACQRFGGDLMPSIKPPIVNNAEDNAFADWYDNAESGKPIGTNEEYSEEILAKPEDVEDDVEFQKAKARAEVMDPEKGHGNEANTDQVDEIAASSSD